MTYTLPMSSENFQNMSNSLIRSLRNNPILVSLTRKTGNAEKAFAEGVKMKHSLEAFAEKYLKIAFPFEKRAESTETFSTMMAFLSCLKPVERRAFFSFFYSVGPRSLAHMEEVALNWLQNFERNKDNPKYERAIVFPMLVMLEESVMQEKSVEENMNPSAVLFYKVEKHMFLQQGVLHANKLAGVKYVI